MPLSLSLFCSGPVLGFMRKSLTAYKLEVSGQAPLAAKYAGFSSSKAIWMSLVISGMMAGIAGLCEVAGPIGQLNPNLSPGYGYAAIIVAYLGRLNPIGIVLSGCFMALIYLGGEMAQMQLQLPVAITGIFQGLLLFFLLASDALIENRYRFSKNGLTSSSAHSNYPLTQCCLQQKEA